MVAQRGEEAEGSDDAPGPSDAGMLNHLRVSIPTWDENSLTQYTRHTEILIWSFRSLLLSTSLRRFGVAPCPPFPAGLAVVPSARLRSPVYWDERKAAG
jgi:hypothetical protein